MVVRFLYRLVSLFFFVCALLSWLVMAAAIYAQFKAQAFSLESFAVSILSAAMAAWAHSLSIDAWRAARYRRYDPLWRDFP